MISIREILGELVGMDVMITDKDSNTFLVLVKRIDDKKKEVIVEQTDLISGGTTGKQQPIPFPFSRIKKVVPADPEDRERFKHTIEMMKAVDDRIGKRTVTVADTRTMGKVPIQIMGRDKGRVFVNLMDVGPGRNGRRCRLMLSDIKSISPS